MTREGTAMFKVFVADNYHFMEQDSTYKLGEYPTWAEAEAAARRLVDECLREGFRPGMGAEDLYGTYVSFGDDPYIVPTPAGEDRFSAWDYAKRRCEEMCAATVG
jgi:hypothetical protein